MYYILETYYIDNLLKELILVFACPKKVGSF